MNKKKNQHKRTRLPKDAFVKNNGHSLRGKPTPVETTFQTLRDRAMQTPMLKEFTKKDVNLERHSKLFDFDSNYFMAVVVLAVLRHDQFFWSIQSCFVSKISGKLISLDLLTNKQRDELQRAKKQALGDAGSERGVEKFHTNKYYLWHVPFADKDYENPMVAPFLEYVEKGEK